MAKNAIKREKNIVPRQEMVHAEMSESAALVLRRFRLVFNAVKTHVSQVEKKAGVGGAQLWALSVIRDGAGDMALLIGQGDVSNHAVW